MWLKIKWINLICEYIKKLINQFSAGILYDKSDLFL